MSETGETVEDFQIGDIVWAKIGKYPYWPSIICKDPETKTHLRFSDKNKKNVKVHVRFCNDHGRRSWVTHIEKLNSNEDIIKKYPKTFTILKNPTDKIAWRRAFSEGFNGWKTLPREERVRRFLFFHRVNEKLEAKKEKKKKIVLLTPEEKKANREKELNDMLQVKINAMRATYAFQEEFGIDIDKTIIEPYIQKIKKAWKLK